jgi:hypothetical protein
MFIFLQLKSFYFFVYYSVHSYSLLLPGSLTVSSYFFLFKIVLHIFFLIFLYFFFSDFSDCSSGIDGRVDTKPICGTTVARKKARAGKEGKVRKIKKNPPIYNLPYDILLWMPLLFLVSIFFSVINTVADFWCFFLGWGCHFH